MDQSAVALYLHEVIAQSQFTNAALTVFNQSAEQQAGVGILFAAQAALTSASHIGNILWPTRARHRRRGEVLRNLLDLPEKHAFADRRFAELWDNADQKLEDWIDANKSGRAVVDVIAPLDQLGVDGLEESHLLRAYDPQSRIFYYRGIGYNLQTLAKNIGDIGARASQAAAKLEREAHRPDG
ncbi:MAG: hypothetical protein ACFB22_14345 [Rhodothalassiaceae bacterium]